MGIIHSKNYSIRKKLFKKIFIQKIWELFIQKNYSFFWKIDYRPGLLQSWWFLAVTVSVRAEHCCSWWQACSCTVWQTWGRISRMKNCIIRIFQWCQPVQALGEQRWHTRGRCEWRTPPPSPRRRLSGGDNDDDGGGSCRLPGTLRGWRFRMVLRLVMMAGIFWECKMDWYKVAGDNPCA